MLILCCHHIATADAFPLVSLADYDNSITITMRYATNNNFVGRMLEGYHSNTCLLSKPAARALAAVQHDLREQSFSLIVYDCYRPQRASDHFVRWANDPQDTVNKAQYYPNVAKEHLFADGYIAKQSSHSRGSAVDLSLLSCTDGHCEPLDMGTRWDYLDPLATTEISDITKKQQANRLTLRDIMETHGFNNYPKEWWHYTLNDEPYPNDYFDEPIRKTHLVKE